MINYGLKQRIVSLFVKEFDSDKWWEYRKKAKSGGIIALLKYQSINRKEHAFIPLNAFIESKPIFPHGISGVYISQGARIGKNVVIFHHVTIGSNNLHGSKNNGTPVVGNNVYIGCGAKIIGDVIVGDNARIGANCVVFSEIPENATVVLEGIRIIEHDCLLDNTFNAFDSN